MSSRLPRGRFIAGVLGTAIGAALPKPALAAYAAAPSPRYLWLRRQDSGHEVRAPITLDDTRLYWPGYRSLCWMLRDAHVRPERGYREISVLTLKVLWEIQYLAATEGVVEPIIVHSGFRSFETNARIEGAARNSFHLYGMAVDFHVPRIPIAELHLMVRARPDAGGVGLYDRGGGEGWIHLDTGWKRNWNG